MSRSIRPSTPADAASIVELLTEAGLRPNLEPEHLYWKYWQPRADWPGPRSFLLVEGSQPVAHGALAPRTGLWRGGRATVAHVIDWAARRSAAGAGAMLMKHIGQQVDALLAIGGSAETLAILPHLGFCSVGTATGYARVLHPLRLLHGRANRPFRRVARFARGVARALTAPAAATDGWQARRIGVGDLSALQSLLPRPRRGIALLGRSAGHFEHLLVCPIAPMQLHLVERQGRACGYFLMSFVPGQVRIADCWMDSDDHSEWRAMIGCAVALAKSDPQAAEIVGWASDPLHAHALEGCGFHARHAHPVQVRTARETTMPVAPLRVQMLDSDAAYLYDRRRQFWT